MPGDFHEVDDLSGFDVRTRRAIASAEVEARQLGHDRVGTEHLLLGVLAHAVVDDVGGASPASAATPAAALLRDAGLTVSATRHKVREAGGRAAVQPGNRASGRLPRTARADRAIARSIRFSRDHRAEAVECEHLLLGVLDVEGTAGQVIRGLGVDVDQLRSALHDLGATRAATARDDVVDAAPSAPADAASQPPVRCPACAATLDDSLTYRTLTASGHHVPNPVTVYSCAVCGAFLGLSPTSGG